MKVVAYSYSDPLLETPPDQSIWGWELDCLYQDLGGRQALEQLFKDCKIEPPKYLLLRRFEELGNSVQEVSDRLSQLEAFQVNIIPIESELQPAYSTLTRADLIKLLAAIQIEVQASQRSHRIAQGHAQNRLKALPPPGKAPYGYRRGKDRYALDRSTAPVVKDFFERFLIYGSLRGAVRYLEQRYGKTISVTTGRRWLTNPVYRGDLEYKNGDIISNTHVAIISREEGAQVDRLLRRNQRMSPRSASAPRSLSGLVFCAECQCLMTVMRVTAYRKEREYLYLRSTDCPQTPKCKSLAYNEVLATTIQRVCEDLPCAVAQLNLPDMGIVKTRIDQAIADKQAILDQLPQYIETGVLDPETANLRAYKLQIEIAEFQDKLAQLPPVNLQQTAQAVSLPQFWLDLTETERRFYFREFIRQIDLIREGKSWQLEIKFVF
ncbi:MAG: recombinase family protein [Microcoleaceae cyanobacterium]